MLQKSWLSFWRELTPCKPLKVSVWTKIEIDHMALQKLSTGSQRSKHLQDQKKGLHEGKQHIES